ncbi:MAG: bifunctional phosphoribosylaminoimidazolecarboxamide formyltransferase/IMP cyclohydrolase [archaeon]
MVKRVLISVSDKTGVVDFAKGLADLGWEIISTGGTAKLLRENGVDTVTVSELTGFPEILDGRLKSLHPKVHGGILAKRDEKHLKELREHYIPPIDIVAVNLYPFEQTVGKDHTFDQAVENIDIGGPTMIRAAAKNFKYVTVIVHPADYGEVVKAIETNGETSAKAREELARKAFTHTARYDTLISGYLNKRAGITFPQVLNLTFKKKQDTRYGENPHQHGAFYIDKDTGLAAAVQLNGKEMSFNNILDATAAVRIAREFSEPACVIVKHNNPCGVAIGTDPSDAYLRALATDPISSFGGVVAFNEELSESAAAKMGDMFFEIIIAPSYEEGALNSLKEKKNLRVLQMPIESPDKGLLDIKRVDGGILLQDEESKDINIKDVRTATKRTPSEKELEDMLFAWKIVKHVRSNAIVFAKDKRTLGIGAGQMSRIDSTHLAVKKAGDAKLDLSSCVMASDAFFPFKDNVEHAAKVGVTAIIQPGGSVRDQESVDAADKAGMAMSFTGTRVFRH